MTVDDVHESCRPFQYYQRSFVFMSLLTCPLTVMVDEMCISEPGAIVLMQGMRSCSCNPASRRCPLVNWKGWQRIIRTEPLWVLRGYLISA